MAKKVYLYPLWLRVWHWSNALLFFLLIISGISLHYSDSNAYLFSFRVGIIVHNISGVLLTLNYIFYFVRNITTGNYKYYIPVIRGIQRRLTLQTRYYIWGIFKGEDHPFHTSEKQKFNPMQQIAYFSIMFLGMPLILLSGWLLMFPELAPEQFLGMGGVWPMAILHTIVGYGLSLFMLGHIYLATHGDTVWSNFKSMIDGWHLHGDEH